MSVELHCAPCEVTWSADETATCWLCDGAGVDRAESTQQVGILTVAQAMAQQRIAEQRRLAAERVRRFYASTRAAG